MKSFTFATVAAFALLVPALASAGPSYTMVYRPELRTTVLVPSRTEGAPLTETRQEMLARHRAMAAAYRTINTRSAANPADHCDRIIAELQQPEQAQR